MSVCVYDRVVRPIVLTLFPVVLWAQGIVAGRVVDGVTGQGVPRATVSLSNGEEPEGGFQGLSDVAGNFEFSAVPAGRSYRLRVEKRTYLRADLPRYEPFASLLIGPVGLRGISISLMPQAVLAGVLVDPKGEPLEGMSVAAHTRWTRFGNKELLRTGRSDVTDDRGRFRVAGLEGGEYALTVNSREIRESHRVRAGESLTTLRVTYPQRKEFTISGRLTQKVVAPYSISLKTIPGEYSGTANADGTFTISHVLPGSYLLVADISRADEHPEHPIETGRVVIDQADVAGVQLTPQGRTTLGGRVRVEGSTSRPLAGLALKVVAVHSGSRSYSVKSAADGSFSVPNFPSGPYRIWFTTPVGMVVREILAEEMEKGPAEIVLSESTAGVRGEVEFPDDDEFYRRGVVYFVPVGGVIGGGYDADRYEAMGDDMSFAMRTLAPGRYRAFAAEGKVIPGVSAEVLDGLGSAVTTIELAPGETNRIVLPLIQGAAIRAAGLFLYESLMLHYLVILGLFTGLLLGQGPVSGRIVDAISGKGLAETAISLTLVETSLQRLEAVTGSQGEFTFPTVPAGFWTAAVIKKRGYLPTSYPAPLGLGAFAVGPAGLAGLTVKVMPQSVLAGVLVDSTGEPLEGVSLQAVRQQEFGGRSIATGVHGFGRTNDLGEFRLAQLPAGEYVLRAGERRLAEAYRVGQGEERGGLRVVVPEKEKGFTVSGRLAESAGGRRPKMVGARLADVATPVRRDGSFTLPSVPPGNHRVVAFEGEEGEAECFVGTVSVRDAPVDGVLLRRRPTFTLNGRIRRVGEGTLPLGGQTISFVPPVVRDCVSNLPLTATTTADGRFSIPNFPRGVAGMSVAPLPGSYVSAMLENGKEIEVVFDERLARVTGRYEGESTGSGPMTVTVCLVPEDRTGGRATQSVRLSPPGREYSFAGVVPGRYRIFASELFLDDAEFVQALFGSEMRTITLGPGEGREMVLPVITVAAARAAGVVLQ